MRAALIWTLDLALIANGAFMLFAPETWYELIPGVTDTGPFNTHFLRDIGLAYLVAGGGLLLYCVDERARPAAVAGAAFLSLHALVHLWDVSTGRESLAHFLEDVPTVIAPGLLILMLARPRFCLSKEDFMLRWLMRRRITAFEKAYGILQQNRALLDRTAAALLETETLDEPAIERLKGEIVTAPTLPAAAAVPAAAS